MTDWYIFSINIQSSKNILCISSVNHNLRINVTTGAEGGRRPLFMEITLLTSVAKFYVVLYSKLEIKQCIIFV